MGPPSFPALERAHAMHRQARDRRELLLCKTGSFAEGFELGRQRSGAPVFMFLILQPRLDRHRTILCGFCGWWLSRSHSTLATWQSTRERRRLSQEPPDSPGARRDPAPRVRGRGALFIPILLHGWSSMRPVGTRHFRRSQLIQTQRQVLRTIRGALAMIVGLAVCAHAAAAEQVFPLTDTKALVARNVDVAAVDYQGRKAVRLIRAQNVNGFALLSGTDFRMAPSRPMWRSR